MKRSYFKSRLLPATPTGLTLAMTLLIGGTVCPSGLLKAYAQAVNTGFEQESSLPPAVVPIDPLTTGATGSAISANDSNNTTPGLASQSTALGSEPVKEMQSAQDFRKAYMDYLAGQAIDRQWNGQNPYNNPSAQNDNQFVPNPQLLNQVNNQSVANQGQPPLGQPDLMPPKPDNTITNASPPQTQTLTGPATLSQAPRRGGNSYAHALGIGTSAGATIFNGLTTGGSGAYNLGLTGGSLLNYGYLNGFKF